ncbi:MAG: acyl-CoA dehydrogenase, partial [Novosphingobium sp.]|nr:acyl-CoA dehydrogenase [Novosphingobium sp.]
CAVAVAGWQLGRQSRASGLHAKTAVTKFFNRVVVPEARGLGSSAMAGAALLYDLDSEALVR